ncbi:hypothetical protein F3Y22_tig00111105pilonHSYRG00045 [Hibiscus syriacus]|uniref:Uncharacterized protein n=1 Tax=Hibiscus syriacus TaxID=106335 RepID=A0A6A2YZB4_HIBSY|nr:hypothetical protein F3Y22_tig00111105pilonHSYRG00045 [Hibiscus syriacus]
MPSGKNDKAKSGAKKKVSKENLKCYFCDSPYLIRECPEKCRLTTIMKRMGEGEVAKIGTVTSVKATKPGKRLGPIKGINVAKQGSRRGKAVDVEGVEPGRKRDETACVKAVKHKKRPDAITRDKAVKLRVQSEQVCSQYDKIEAWSKLRCLRHKGTLKEYRVLERREVNELSKALTTAESVKEFGVKKNKTFKTKPKAEGSGKRIHDEGKSKDGECCSLSGRESPLNDEPDGEYEEDVCNLGTSSSVKDAKPRVMDEPMIELSREDDEPRIEEALRVGSIRFISAKASRSQVQEELSVSKEFAEHVRVENMTLETILRKGSKQGLAEDVQVRNNPSKTSRHESKDAKTLRDKATTEKLANNKWEITLVYFPTEAVSASLCHGYRKRLLLDYLSHSDYLKALADGPFERKQRRNPSKPPDSSTSMKPNLPSGSRFNRGPRLVAAPKASIMDKDKAPSALKTLRGCGDPKFIKVAKQFIRDNKLYVVSFVEPRISGVKAAFVIAKLDFPNSHHIEAKGFSGGLWLCWFNFIRIQVLIGDFNAIFHLSDRIGSASSTTITLCNSHWDELYPESFMHNLLRICSDHRSILLHSRPPPRHSHPRQFRYFSGWLAHDDFERMVLENWKSASSLSETISNFNDVADTWSKNVFGYIGAKKRAVMARLRGVQKALDRRQTASLSSLEFNLQAPHHKAKNRISTLKTSDGEWCYDDTKLQSKAINFFRHLYADSDSPSGQFPYSESTLDSLGNDLCGFMPFVIHIVAKGVDWKAIVSELQKDPNAGGKHAVKKRLPKKIRQIPDCYFLPWMFVPSALAFYGPCIAGGIGAGMLLELWINKKIKVELIANIIPPPAEDGA